MRGKALAKLALRDIRIARDERDTARRRARARGQTYEDLVRSAIYEALNKKIYNAILAARAGGADEETIHTALFC